MKKILLLIIAILITAAGSDAQSRRSKAYDQFKKNARKEYDDFRMKANREYIKYMGGKWEEKDMNQPIPPADDKKIAPVPAPEEAQKAPEKSTQMPVDNIVEAPVVLKQPQPLSTVTASADVMMPSIDITLYGTPCRVRFDESQKFQLNDLFSGTLAKAWEGLLTPEYDNTLYDCLKIRKDLKLCDWAYYELLQKVADQALGEGNEANLLAAYLFAQSGYKMRLVKDANNVVMVVASEYMLPNRKYIQDAGVTYFATKDLDSKIMTLNIGFPKEQTMSMQITELPVLKADPAEPKMLTSRKSASMLVSVDRNLLDFFEHYPTAVKGNDNMTRWAMYANTPIDQRVKDQLYPYLKADIDSLSEYNAIYHLLNFVQTAFAYGYDDEIWGGDRPFFAEETLFYPYSDCEDRAILFSHLVRDLLGLDIALVYYPGHLATAVNTTEKYDGDYFMVEGEKYLVCDPTYINSAPGQAMDRYKNSGAQLIRLKANS